MLTNSRNKERQIQTNTDICTLWEIIKFYNYFYVIYSNFLQKNVVDVFEVAVNIFAVGRVSTAAAEVENSSLNFNY